MENKDWREEFNETISNVMGICTIDSLRIKSFIESLLKSKQEEIEKAMENMKKNPKKDIVYCTSYELALDDLKPIISNIFK